MNHKNHQILKLIYIMKNKKIIIKKLINKNNNRIQKIKRI